MIVSFSGTGNSRYCAQLLSDKLNDEWIDSGNFIRSGIQAELLSGSPWVFVAPTYAWRLPRVFVDFIRKSWLQGSEDAYFVMTCGSDIGDAGKYNQQLCEELGLTYKGTLRVPMPENYIALFSAPSEEKCRAMIAQAHPLLERVAEQIRKGEQLPEEKVTAVGRLCSSAVNTGFYRYYIKAKLFYATAQCIGCGKCAASCVLNNIALKNGLPHWGDHCTHCMACICGCPVEAIEYGNHSQGKRRYLCPDYKK